MTENSDADESSTDDNLAELAEMEALLRDGIREAHRKVESGRVYDTENEKVRQQWIKTLAYAVNQYRGVVKERKLREIEEKVEQVEQQQDTDSNRFRVN